MKENDSLELSLLERILYRLEKIEADQSLLLVTNELKTLQERGIMAGYQMRFNDIDEDLKQIKEDVRRIRRDTVTIGSFKRTMETVLEKFNKNLKSTKVKIN